MNVSPGRRPVVDDAGTSTAPRRETTRTQLAVGTPSRRAVLGRDVEASPSPSQRRGVARGLHAGVVLVEPPAGRQPDRELVGQPLDRRVVHDGHGTARGSSTAAPRADRGGTARPDATRHSRATGARELLQPPRSSCRRAADESERSSFQTSSALGLAQSWPSRARGRRGSDVVARLAGRLDAPCARAGRDARCGHGPLGLAPARPRPGTRRRPSRPSREEDVLHDEVVEPLEQMPARAWSASDWTGFSPRT